MDKDNQQQLQLKEEDEPPGSKRLLINDPSSFSGKELTAFYPFYFENLLSRNLQNYYHQNGHLVFLKSLNVEVVTEMDFCHKLWDEFSPRKSIFDLWEFRYAFWRGYQYVPYFMVLKNGKNLGLLPLWYEEDQKKFFWFGSYWHEDNKFFVRDPMFIPLLLSICPVPTILNSLDLETAIYAKEFIVFDRDCPKYVLNLEKFNTLANYLAFFDKKTRYNLKRDRRIIESQKPEIVIDNFTDFNHLVKLSRGRFKQKGELSSWEDPRRIATFEEIIKIGKKNKPFRARMITVKIGDKIAGVDLIALYNGCYTPLVCGYDVVNFPGIGNFMNLVEIEDALNFGMKRLDFLQSNFGHKDSWKERLFEEIPLFKYTK